MIPILVAFNVFLYYAWIDRYALGILWSIVPLYWYLFTVLSGLTVVLLSADLSLPKGAAGRLVVWACVFVAMSSLSFVFSTQGSVATQKLITSVEAAVLLCVFLLFFRDNKSLVLSCSAIAAAVVIGSILNIVDFLALSPLPLSITPGRAAGLYQNPNISGNYLVLGMVIATWVVPKRARWWFCLGVGCAVFLTFSRASILMWGLAVASLAWYGRFSLRRVPSIMIAVFLVSVIGMAMASGQMTEILSTLGLGQHLTADASARVTGTLFEQGDTSSTGRLFLLSKSIKWFFDAPLFGHGIGKTFEWGFGGSTHNMFLLYAVEMGVLGIAMFCALLWILWSTGTDLGRIIALLFTLSSLFSHNNLEHPAMMVVLAVAVSAIDRESRSGTDVWARRRSWA